VGRGGVHLPGLRVTAARWRDPHPRLRADRSVLQRTVPALAEALAAWPSAVADRLDPLALALAEDDGFAAGNAAAALLGLGPGLTPAGDDVLAGALATLSLLLPPPPPPPPLPPPPPPPPPPPAAPVAAPARPSVERNPRPRRFLSAHAVAEAPRPGAWAGLDGAVAGMAVRRTTALSAALLGCARRGQVAAPAADLLRSGREVPVLGPLKARHVDRPVLAWRTSLTVGGGAAGRVLPGASTSRTGAPERASAGPVRRADKWPAW